MNGALIGLALQMVAGNFYDPNTWVRDFETVSRIGVEAVAPVGATLAERDSYVTLKAVQVGGEAGKATVDGKRTIDAGAQLAILKDGKRLIACQTDHAVQPLCLTDRDRDGRFDVANTSDGWRPAKLPAPIAYQPGGTVRLRGPDDGVRQTLSYRGVSGGRLVLGVREIGRDSVARAEELSMVALPAAYPQTVTVKDFTIELLGVSDAGLRYVVRQAEGG